MDGTPFFSELKKATEALGGLFNAHLHLDRAGTLHLHASGPAGPQSSLSLPAKHRLIPTIHDSPEYEPARLRTRVEFYIDQMVSAGTREAETLVDVTADRVGLSALQTFLELKLQYAGRLDLRVGAYSPLGFMNSEPERWNLLVSGAQQADLIGSLPERDDRIMYPAHIGFDEHCLKIIDLSQQLNKPLHIHVDQRNDPSEDGTERIIRAIDKLGISFDSSQEPMIWLVHVISPSTYSEPRFKATLSELARLNIGIICCSSAALSMRQLRPIATPTYNSIARVLDMLAAGIHVRVGSDNICDIASPAGTSDLLNEIFVLANALRFYDIGILAKIAYGRRLDRHQCKQVQEHLVADAAEAARVIERYGRGQQTELRETVARVQT